MTEQENPDGLRSPLRLACPETWPAATVCNAWGAPSSHGCKLEPGHTSYHRCLCGRSTKENTASLPSSVVEVEQQPVPDEDGDGGQQDRDEMVHPAIASLSWRSAPWDHFVTPTRKQVCISTPFGIQIEGTYDNDFEAFLHIAREQPYTNLRMYVRDEPKPVKEKRSWRSSTS